MYSANEVMELVLQFADDKELTESEAETDGLKMKKRIRRWCRF